jgi:hypothetical protein
MLAVASTRVTWVIMGLSALDGRSWLLLYRDRRWGCWGSNPIDVSLIMTTSWQTWRESSEVGLFQKSPTSSLIPRTEISIVLALLRMG